jgi:hypothetical protein
LRVDDIVLVAVLHYCKSFLLDVLGFGDFLLLIHCEAFANEMIDIFAKASLTFEPVINLSRRASYESCNVRFDFIHHV